MANRIVSLIVELTAPGEVRNSAGRKLRASADELPLYLRETVELQLTVQSGGVAQNLSAYTSFELVGRDPADLDSAAPLVRSTDHTTSTWTALASGRVGMTLNANTVELAAFLTAETGEIALAFSAWSAGAFGQFLAANWRALAVRTPSVVGDGSPVYAGGLRHNLTATTSPGVGDDSADGYGQGSVWRNTSLLRTFMCQDATLGAAVWRRLDQTAVGEALAIAATAAAQRTELGLGGAALLAVGTGAGDVAAGNHAHATLYAALSLLTAAGGRYRATGAGVAAQVLPTSALADLTGAVTPALIADQIMTASVTGAITGWTPTGLEIGEGCTVVLSNASLYAVATTGLTEDHTGALAEIAAAAVTLVIWREAAGYRAQCQSRA